MKKLVGFILFSFLLKVGMAQTIPTFSKIFGDSLVLNSGSAIVCYHDSIYFSMIEQDVPVSYQAISFVKTDSLGNKIALKKIYYPAYYYYAGSMRMTTDGFLVTAGGLGSYLLHKNSGASFKLNRNTLDTVSIQFYSGGNISGFYGFAELSDGNYLFSGETGDSSIPGKGRAWLVKTDTTGAELWQKTMASDNYNVAYSTYPFANGFYQPWATGHDNTLSGNSADSAIFVDKYDNTGNLKWRDTFGIIGHDNKIGPNTGLRDGGGIVVVNVLDTTGYMNGPTVIYKYDSNGIIQWQHYIPQLTQLADMIETQSGSIVACGWGSKAKRGQSGSYRAAGDLIKFDKDGNLIFFQVFEYDTTKQDQLNAITETADGGYACVGNAYELIGNTYYQRAWLLKVDSNGCLNGDCPTIATGLDEIPTLQTIFVFPNPATTRFTLALAGPNDIYQYHDLHFTLYDLTGREVYSQPISQQTTTVERGDLSRGLYLWTIADGTKMVTNGKISFR